MRSVEGGIDSAMSFNVFEHIEDDRSAMRNVQQVLEPGGHFVCFVPACKLLYGRMDQDLGHHRRYSKPELAAKAKEAGFEIVELKYVNLIGFFAWLVNGRLLRSGEVSGGASAMRLYDRFMVPLTRFIESHWQPPFGQSLLLVARKPIG
jgi:SAM-dependent methyltransferase